MKLLMLKHKIKKWTPRKTLAILASLLIVGAPLAHAVTSQDLQQQIDALNQQNAQNQQNVDQLAAQASSYEDALNKLDRQINTLQQQIVSNQNKQVDIQNQITTAQAELEQQKKVLGENIKAMYLEGDISALEVLASSGNLSEYVDKEQNHNAVQVKVANTLAKINDLKQQLLSQKNSIEALLSQQQSIKDQLANDSYKQSQMLGYTQGQKENYNQQIKDNNSKIASLIAAQRAANRSSKNGALMAGTSSYAYADWGFSMSTSPGCVNNDGPDAWGYCTRQCVSYAAWAVAHSGRSAPMYYGNARDWVWHALRDGVPVYSFTNPDGYSGASTGGPQPGDVAISTSSYWGHAMYVEAINGTEIYVSQYNADVDGQFTHQWRDASNYYFLRFP